MTKTHIIVCVHSAINSFERRNTVRKTWARDQTGLPLQVIFLLGTDQYHHQKQEEIQKESQRYLDILQEDFVDTYANLTLKSMFMLKFVENSADDIKYVMKVDDDSYLNLKRLVDYVSIMEKRCHPKCILGRVLGANSPVIRPNEHDEFTVGWEVPTYMYNQTTFPNAVSGSGYLISRASVPCLYENGLQTPYINLEDIFITGLAASKCQVKLKNSQWFHYVGKQTNLVRHQDILIHGLKEEGRMKQLFDKLH
jgi:beta-1,3-galactosyltransferase 1